MRAPGYYLQRALGYQQDILRGKVPACRWVRLACERNARDMKRQRTAAFPFYFSAKHAEKVCASLEQFPHIKGPKAKMLPTPRGWRWQTIELEPWQCWIVCVLFGWLRVEDDMRRYRTSLTLIPRKNAKSTLAAGLSLYMLAADGEGGSDVHSAATKRDQARIVYNAAAMMARRTPEYKDYFGVTVMEREIRVEKSGSTMTPLSADEQTLDGLNPHFGVVDELHAHKTRGVWDVLETALGSRAQPMLFAITTAGVLIGGICHELWQYGQKVLTQVLADETYFCINYTVDEGDLEHWDTEDVFRKANPNYGVSVFPDYLRSKANKARHTPAALNNFLTKHLNVWVYAAAPWMVMEEWYACRAENGLQWEDFLQAETVVITVDLAEVRDFASICVTGLFPDGIVRVKAKHYFPEAAVQASPVAQMTGWVHEGWITETPGNVQDFALLEEEVKRLYHLTNATRVGFDRALAAHLIQDLQRDLGQDVILEIPQSVKVMDPAMKMILGRAFSRTIQHDGDPVLAWMVSNVAEKKNHLDESYPVKAGGKDSPQKIDGAIAMLMGVHETLAGGPGYSPFDDPNYVMPEISL